MIHFFSHAASRPIVKWLLPVSLAAMVLLFVWLILDSHSLSAAVVAPVAPLQSSQPIGVDGGYFGHGVGGYTQTYTHTVTSNSLLPQTVTLTVTSRVGWTVSVSPTSMLLGPGASATALVKMTIPNNALGGTVDVATLTVTAGLAKASGKDSLLVESGKTLAIPPLVMGQMVNGRRVYNLAARMGTTQFRPGINTPTWGYNSNTYLGPTLVMTKTESVLLQVTNNLTEVTTVHWHGLHLPGQTDGGPHQEIDVGQTWKPSFTAINQAATAWYHPHPHGHDGSTAETAIQVYRGLAGMIVVRDTNSAALNVPKTYGVDDFPVVVQDRKFKADGAFDESKDAVGIRNGDSFLVNGTFAGTLEAPAQMVRFRVLNGANHRFLNFGFSDNRSFYQIASDNGFLNAPVQRSRFHMGPGERIEIVVDLSNAQGKTLHFVAYDAELGDTLVPNYTADDFDRSNFILFSIDVTAPTANAVTSIPSTLNNITRYNASNAVRTRILRLTLPPAINNTQFDMETINITSTLGTQEVWSIINQSNDPHPIHIHDSPFQIVKHLDPAGQEIPIPAYEMGWKDTVIVRAGERVDVVKDFSGYADPDGPFMYHCHILEHEGEGMMGQFIITQGQVYLPSVTR
jgi:FtsP/CotA-like multicopper oxidase with cupredoxin domain